jgi:hypothetical protein
MSDFRLRLALLAPFAFSFVQPGSPLIAAAVFAFGVGVWRPLKAVSEVTPHSPSWRVQLKRLAISLTSTLSVVGTLALTAWFVEDSWLTVPVVCAVLIALPLLAKNRTVALAGVGVSLAAALGTALAGSQTWVPALLLASGFLQGLVVEYAAPLTARARSFLLAAVVLFCIGVSWHQLLDPWELVALLAYGLLTAALSPVQQDSDPTRPWSVKNLLYRGSAT